MTLLTISIAIPDEHTRLALLETISPILAELAQQAYVVILGAWVGSEHKLAGTSGARRAGGWV